MSTPAPALSPSLSPPLSPSLSIETRAGLIEDTDNRFLGRAVFADLAHSTEETSDLVALALGLRAEGPEDRDALRLIALATVSPDARVWPIKLCRVLSSFGAPVVGVFGAQLLTAGSIMGPGVTVGAARGLVQVAGAVARGEDLAEAIAAHRAANGGRFEGFGVPLRPADERQVALTALVEGTPLAARPYWRLHREVIAQSRTRSPDAPNVVLPIAALLLDLGARPERCGLALSTLMMPVFVAHALEAAESDGLLRALPASVVAFEGAAPRHTATPAPSTAPPALRRRWGRAPEAREGSVYSQPRPAEP